MDPVVFYEPTQAILGLQYNARGLNMADASWRAAVFAGYQASTLPSTPASTNSARCAPYWVDSPSSMKPVGSVRLP